ncbi:substrate-binding domain-containing protein [Conexibacter sp. JD483]|uniref:substrate-binding domain-containing protein n=1 Tax=unclassified Conexibacter TaxID=2627773 RepID=UPI0027264715|nr:MULTISPECIES: substrate-binding domain-containing protein [unclassified Conexibacter]MDO8184984.1 substrate-binding domain-containing protein [Conexibacter sp. CPCC 205706]MDO8198128.1 substrate-binding domain-containing protein [Conexibacter sp. CPCC 205762]MDR9368250.1 substrate-binding domain-containing protein [Conexibacter sp. JD483]
MVRTAGRLTALGLGMAALTFAGCGEKSDGSSATSGSGSSKSGPTRVVFIQQNSGNPYFDNIAEGFKAAGERLGYEFTATGPSTAAAADQVPLIQDQIQKQVDAIAIQASDPKAVLPALRQAKAKGIKIIAVNSDQIAEVRDAAVTPVDFERVGEAQLALLGELMDYSGDFAVLSATTTAPFQLTVIDHIRRLLASDPRYRAMRLVKVAYGNDEPQKSTTETQGLLTSFPQLKGILAPTTVGLPAAAQAIATAGKGGRVALTGVGQPNQMRKFVKDGVVEKFQLWVPYDQGYVGGTLLKGLVDGEIEGRPGVSFDAGRYGTQRISETGVVYVAPEMTVFDRDNIDDYDF